jgi:methyltransferase (TIGR00027 family)
MTDQVAIRSAETMAFMRAVVSGEKSLAVRSEDRLARHFLGNRYRLLVSLSFQSTLRAALEYVVPGSYGFTIARTRHFDENLLAECRAGAEQVVLLGAGYDSRAFRFKEALRNIRVFEIDHPGTQARKRQLLSRTKETVPANLTFIPVDFTRQSLPEVLAAHGFATDKKTTFLWEGVSYYLPRSVVEDVLAFVGSCAGSSVIFDYATKAYVDGDTASLGGKQVARWLKRMREPFLFGLDPQETRAFLAMQSLDVVSEFGPAELAEAYLKTADGRRVGGLFGHIRMVHARAARKNEFQRPRNNLVHASDNAAAQTGTVRGLNDRLRQTFTGGRVVLSPCVLSLPPEKVSKLLDRVRTFTAFESENDESHEYGQFWLDGEAYCFELECVSRSRDGSLNAENAGKTTRVLTIMRLDEY